METQTFNKHSFYTRRLKDSTLRKTQGMKPIELKVKPHAKLRISPIVQVIKHYDSDFAFHSTSELACNEFEELPPISRPFRPVCKRKPKRLAPNNNKKQPLVKPPEMKTSFKPRINPSTKPKPPKLKNKPTLFENSDAVFNNRLETLQYQIQYGLQEVDELPKSTPSYATTFGESNPCYIQSLKDEIASLPSSCYGSAGIAAQLKTEISEYLISRVDTNTSMQKCNSVMPEAVANTSLIATSQPYSLPEFHQVDVNACASTFSQFCSNSCVKHSIGDSNCNVCNCPNEEAHQYEEYSELCMMGNCGLNKPISVVSYNMSQVCYGDQLSQPSICVNYSSLHEEACHSKPKIVRPCPNMQPRSSPQICGVCNKVIVSNRAVVTSQCHASKAVKIASTTCKERDGVNVVSNKSSNLCTKRTSDIFRNKQFIDDEESESDYDGQESTVHFEVCLKKLNTSPACTSRVDTEKLSRETFVWKKSCNKCPSNQAQQKQPEESVETNTSSLEEESEPRSKTLCSLLSCTRKPQADKGEKRQQFLKIEDQKEQKPKTTCKLPCKKKRLEEHNKNEEVEAQNLDKPKKSKDICMLPCMKEKRSTHSEEAQGDDKTKHIKEKRQCKLCTKKSRDQPASGNNNEIKEEDEINQDKRKGSCLFPCSRKSTQSIEKEGKLEKTKENSTKKSVQGKPRSKCKLPCVRKNEDNHANERDRPKSKFRCCQKGVQHDENEVKADKPRSKCKFPSCHKSVQRDDDEVKVDNPKSKCKFPSCHKNVQSDDDELEVEKTKQKCKFPSCHKSVQSNDDEIEVGKPKSKCKFPSCHKSVQSDDDEIEVEQPKSKCKFPSCHRSVQSDDDGIEVEQPKSKCKFPSCHKNIPNDDDEVGKTRSKCKLLCCQKNVENDEEEINTDKPKSKCRLACCHKNVENDDDEVKVDKPKSKCKLSCCQKNAEPDDEQDKVDKTKSKCKLLSCQKGVHEDEVPAERTEGSCKLPCRQKNLQSDEEKPAEKGKCCLLPCTKTDSQSDEAVTQVEKPKQLCMLPCMNTESQSETQIAKEKKSEGKCCILSQSDDEDKTEKIKRTYKLPCSRNIAQSGAEKPKQKGVESGEKAEKQKGVCCILPCTQKKKSDEDTQKCREYTKIIEQQNEQIQNLMELLSKAERAMLPKKSLTTVEHQSHCKSCSKIIIVKKSECIGLPVTKERPIKTISNKDCTVQFMPPISIPPPLVTQTMPSIIIEPSESSSPRKTEKNVAYNIVSFDKLDNKDVTTQTHATKVLENVGTQIDIKSTKETGIQVVKNEDYCCSEAQRSRSLSNDSNCRIPFKHRATITEWVQSQKEVKDFMQEMMKDPDTKMLYKSYQLIGESDRLEKNDEVPLNDRTMANLSNMDLEVYKTFINPDGLNVVYTSNTSEGNCLAVPNNFYVDEETQYNLNNTKDELSMSIEEKLIEYHSSIGENNSLQDGLKAFCSNKQVETSTSRVCPVSTSTCVKQQDVVGSDQLKVTTTPCERNICPIVANPAKSTTDQRCVKTNSKLYKNLLDIVDSNSSQYVITHDVSVQVSKTKCSPCNNNNTKQSTQLLQRKCNEKPVLKACTKKKESSNNSKQMLSQKENISNTCPNACLKQNAKTVCNSIEKPNIHDSTIMPISIVTKPEINFSGGDTYLPSYAHNKIMYQREQLTDHIESKSQKLSEDTTEYSSGEVNKSYGEIYEKSSSYSSGEVLQKSADSLKKFNFLNKGGMSLQDVKKNNINWVSRSSSSDADSSFTKK